MVNENGGIDMLDLELVKYADSIKEADHDGILKATERQGQLAKPPGALGKLESISIKYAGITGRVKNYIKKKAIVILVQITVFMKREFHRLRNL